MCRIPTKPRSSHRSDKRRQKVGSANDAHNATSLNDASMNYGAERVFSNDIVRIAAAVAGPVDSAKSLRSVVSNFCASLQAAFELTKDIHMALTIAIVVALEMTGKGGSVVVVVPSHFSRRF